MYAYIVTSDSVPKRLQKVGKNPSHGQCLHEMLLLTTGRWLHELLLPNQWAVIAWNVAAYPLGNVCMNCCCLPTGQCLHKMLLPTHRTVAAYPLGSVCMNCCCLSTGQCLHELLLPFVTTGQCLHELLLPTLWVVSAWNVAAYPLGSVYMKCCCLSSGQCLHKMLLPNHWAVSAWTIAA